MNRRNEPASILDMSNRNGSYYYKHMTVLSEHSVEEVFDAIDKAKRHLGGAVKFHGYKVGLTRLRLKNFRENGIICVSCNVKGNVFRLERHTKQDCSPWHLNLYALGPSGIILMTRDHIIPRSKRGSNRLDNLQPMCEECNKRKGSLSQEDFDQMKMPWTRIIKSSRVRLDTLLRRIKFVRMMYKKEGKLILPSRVNSGNKGSWLGFILQ